MWQVSEMASHEAISETCHIRLSLQISELFLFFTGFIEYLENSTVF